RDVNDLVAETLIDTPDVLAEGLSHLEGHLAFVVRRVDLAPRRKDEHAVVVAVVVRTRRLETKEVRVADEIGYSAIIEGARMFLVVGFHPLQHEVAEALRAPLRDAVTTGCTLLREHDARRLRHHGEAALAQLGEQCRFPAPHRARDNYPFQGSSAHRVPNAL